MTAQGAGPAQAQAQEPLRVRAGEQLVLRAPAGVIHAEAADPSVVAVTMPSPDTIVVRGIRPADTLLLLITSATVVTQPVHVTPSLAPSGAAPDASSPVGSIDLTYLPETQTFWADVHRSGLSATISPSGWQVHVINGGLTVVGASTLQTSLQAFGIGGGWGTSLRTTDGWELVAGPAQSQLAHHWRLGGPDEFTLAATVAGPLATMHLERGGISLDLAALNQNGATQAAGVVTATVGTVLVASSFSPQGGGLSAQMAGNGWTLSAASDSQGAQLGLSATVGAGRHVNLWWAAQGGYGFGMTLPLAHAGTLTIAANSGTSFATLNTRDNPAGGVTTTTGFGAGQLTVTGPSPSFPIALTLPMVPRVSPSPQLVPGTPYLLTPYLVRASVEIPGGPAAAPPAPGYAVGLGPVSIPTGSAALIAHVCLHSASANRNCAPGDPTIAVRMYVDDRPVEVTGVALPIAPGPHTIAIQPQDLPAFLVALGPLSCPITVAAGEVAVCDFAFRQAGTASTAR